MTAHFWRSVRFAGVAALAGALAVGSAALPAAAAPANLDPAENRDLFIHAFHQPSSAFVADPAQNTGEAITIPADATPLRQVDFTVQQVTSLDLTDYAGWNAAEGLTAAQVLADPAAYPLGADIGGRTGDDGLLSITDDSILPIGLYLVQQGTDHGNNGILRAADPFLVSIPQALGDGDWSYQVHVYPKAPVGGGISKTVDDSQAIELGDLVTWTIDAAVPQLAPQEAFDEYVITDTLESRLGFQSVSASLADGTVLDAGVHYTPSTPAVGASGAIALTFEQAGLDLLGAHQGSSVAVTLTTSVLGIDGASTDEVDGILDNQAFLQVNGVEYASEEPQTPWGALQVLKHVTGDEANVLGGARFGVFGSAADAAAKQNAIEELVSDTATGLTEVLALKAGTYFLAELEPPAGYTASTDVYEIVVTAGALADAELQAVPNTQKPEYPLPLTGGTGTLAFTIAGGALLLAAVAGGVIIARRRQHA